MMTVIAVACGNARRDSGPVLPVIVTVFKFGRTARLSMFVSSLVTMPQSIRSSSRKVIAVICPLGLDCELLKTGTAGKLRDHIGIGREFFECGKRA